MTSTWSLKVSPVSLTPAVSAFGVRPVPCVPDALEGSVAASLDHAGLDEVRSALTKGPSLLQPILDKIGLRLLISQILARMPLSSGSTAIAVMRVSELVNSGLYNSGLRP